MGAKIFREKLRKMNFADCIVLFDKCYKYNYNIIKNMIKHETREKFCYSEFMNSPAAMMIHSTDVKLNFVNLITKGYLGGDTSDLFGIIGNDITNGEAVYINIIKYINDENIVLITETKSFAKMKNGRLSGVNMQDILSLIILFCRIVDLKIGYVSYQVDDALYDFFNNIGFVCTNLDCDDGQIIMLDNNKSVVHSNI